MTVTMIRVTSHALVRWMERRVGADVEALRVAALDSSRQALGADAPRAIGDADLVEFLEMQKFNLEPMRQRIRDLAAPAVAPGMRPRRTSRRFADAHIETGTPA